MDIYLIRHGETRENKTGIVQGSGVDSILNEKGRLQAASFFNKYKSENFEVVFTSKLKRSIETVQPFILQNIEWIQNADLNEINWGIHEGKKYNPQMGVNYRQLIENWGKGNLDAKLSEGESAAELIQRSDRFINYLRTVNYNKILICTHGRTLRCLMCRFLNLEIKEMESFGHQNTGLYRLEMKEENFILHLKNDYSHLGNDLLSGN